MTRPDPFLDFLGPPRPARPQDEHAGHEPHLGPVEEGYAPGDGGRDSRLGRPRMNSIRYMSFTTTRRAGRLTPAARVGVHEMTLRWRLRKAAPPAFSPGIPVSERQGVYSQRYNNQTAILLSSPRLASRVFQPDALTVAANHTTADTGRLRALAVLTAFTIVLGLALLNGQLAYAGGFGLKVGGGGGLEIGGGITVGAGSGDNGLGVTIGGQASGNVEVDAGAEAAVQGAVLAGMQAEAAKQVALQGIADGCSAAEIRAQLAVQARLQASAR